MICYAIRCQRHSKSNHPREPIFKLAQIIALMICSAAIFEFYGEGSGTIGPDNLKHICSGNNVKSVESELIDNEAAAFDEDRFDKLEVFLDLQTISAMRLIFGGPS